MKKVLLTGATGFIGRHCLRALADRGYEVHAVSSREANSREAVANVVWRRADVLDRAQTFALVESVRPTHLLHLAWYAVPGRYWTSTENFRWVESGLNLLQAFAGVGGRRVVAAGTCAEYEWGDDAPCSESKTPPRPATLYGACKHAAHVMLEAYAAQERLSAAWGRLFFLYGPWEHPSRLVASVTRSLLRGEAARCSSGRQVRDFLYAEDVASAFVALLDSEVEGAVNVASGRGVTLKEVVEKVGEKVGRPDLIEFGALPSPKGEPGVLVADVSRLRDEVGWRPRYDLDAGLDRTIEWWRGAL
ncbi:MAG TPA: NAD(P)-dependent oxidoreductase [Pyrinomonadaceae bacterium]|nr:NAD(P)-dependent oxidoreductase [Pyrinomonadaceae bacterium]